MFVVVCCCLLLFVVVCCSLREFYYCFLVETAPSSIVIEGLLYGSLFGGRGENTKILFRTDVVASVCHVIVFTDDLGSNRLLMFGIYRKSTGGCASA